MKTIKKNNGVVAPVVPPLGFIGMFFLIIGFAQVLQDSSQSTKKTSTSTQPVQELVEEIVQREFNREFFVSAACPVLLRAAHEELHVDHVFGVVRSAAKKHKVEQELILAVIAAESNCRRNVVSGAGAIGMMQLMPRTAAWLGVKNSFSVIDNIMGGTKYLSYLLSRFDGDLELAVAAYNAGPTVVSKLNRIPPYSETKNYVEKVLTYYRELQNV